MSDFTDHHVVHQNCEEAADLIEQQAAEIEELENTLISLGYCAKCSMIPEHHIDEPFSSCACSTSEDNGTSPLQRLQILEKNNQELATEIDRLRRYVAALESKRPHWAEFFSSDSVAAQLTADALTELWGLLGVHNQTEAVEKLKNMNQQVKYE